MTSQVLWAVESSSALDDRTQDRLAAMLGIAFHGITSPGANTVGHRFLTDGDDGTAVLRAVLRPGGGYAIELVRFGEPALLAIGVDEWMARAEVATRAREAASDRSHADPLSPTLFSGTFVRVTLPHTSALALPRVAPYGGLYHEQGQALPLYATSDFSSACLEILAGGRTDLEVVATEGLPRRVSELYIDEALLLDLRLGPLVSLGMTMDILVSTAAQQKRRELIAHAQEAGAEGLLVPSRWRTGATNLILFQYALDRVVVRRDFLTSLTIADAIENRALRQRLDNQPKWEREFVKALHDGRFEQWVATLTLPGGERKSLRQLATALTA